MALTRKGTLFCLVLFCIFIAKAWIPDSRFMVVSEMGEPLFVSDVEDINLSHTPPNEGFKFIKYPDSPCASLVQVSNEVWMAFNEAHTNMDEIGRLSTIAVRNIRNVVKFLKGGNVLEIEGVVPIYLSKIDDLADRCWILANNTEAKFNQVKKLIAEILETFIASKGHYDIKQFKTEEALQQARIQEKFSEEMKNVLAARHAEREKQVEKAQENVYSAWRSIPSTGEILVMYIVNDIMDCIKSLFSLKPLLNLQIIGGSGENIERDISRKEQTPHKNDDLNFDDPWIIAIVKGIEALTGVDTYMSEPVKEVVDNLKVMYEKTLQALEGNSDTYSKIMLKKTIEIVSKISKYIHKGKKDAKEEKQLKTAADEILQNVLTNKVSVKKDNSLSLKTSKTTLSEQSAENLIDEVNNNVRLKLEVSERMLSEAYEKSDMAFAEWKTETNRLHATHLKMQSLHIRKLRLEKTHSNLSKIIIVLDDVSTLWGNLLEYFQMISKLMSVSLYSYLKTFVQISREIIVQRISLTNDIKESLFEEAAEANRLALFVQNITTAYVKILDKHLMSGITSLACLDLHDPKQVQAEVKRGRENLHTFIKKAADALSQLLPDTKETSTRIKEI